MSFTDQKPRVATAKECETRWGGGKPGERFRCYLCGHKFEPGDQWRWVHATHAGVTNLLVCKGCDGADVIKRWLLHVADGEQRFWWMS